jgi:hypothetical protein
MDHVQNSSIFPTFMYSCLLLMSCYILWWYELPCGRWCKLAQERMCLMMSPNPQPVVVGHFVHLCLHLLHRCLQWATSNWWLHIMPLCRGWQKLVNVRKNIRNNIISLKSPPTSTSLQSNPQSSQRWQTCLKLTTGFTWLSQILIYFTALWFAKCLVGHVYSRYLVQSPSAMEWVLHSIPLEPPSSRNHAQQPVGVPRSTTRDQQCVRVQ